jgi:hypothetical protein
MAAAPTYTVFFPISQEDLERSILLLQEPSNEIKNNNDDSINCLFIIHQSVFTIENCNIFKIINYEPTTTQQIIEILNHSYGSSYMFTFESGDKNFLYTKLQSSLPGQVMLCIKGGKYFLLYHNINPEDGRLIYCNSQVFIDCFLSDPYCSINTDPPNTLYSILCSHIPFPE